MLEYRTGIGYDRHLLTPGKFLVLGGIEIAHSKSLVGHSDGDVLLHALVDAILGACALGDIGTHFPDTDPKWKGAKSELFVKDVLKKITLQHFEITFVDAIILAEKPKLSSFFLPMKENISKITGLPAGRISLKAKTEEGIGSIGEEKSMAAFVVATVRTKDSGAF